MAKIDKATIEVNADIDDLKASMVDAKAEVESVGDAGEKAGGKVGGAFGKAGEAIEGSTAGVRKFSGAISSTVGVVTGLVGAVTGLIGLLVLFGKLMNEQKEQTRLSEKAFKSLKNQIEDFNQEIDPDPIRRQADALGDLIRENKELEDVQKVVLLQLVGSAIAGTQRVEKHKEEADRVRQLNIEWVALKDTILGLESQLETDPVKQEEIRFQARMRAIDRANRSAMHGNQSEFDQIIELEEKLHQKRLDDIKKQKDEKIKAEEEAARKSNELAAKQAAVLAAALKRELSGVAASLLGSTGGITTQLNTIVKDLREVAHAIGRR